MAQQIKLLLIEDEPADARLLKEILSKETNPVLELHQVDRLERGLAYLADGGADVVLVDLFLPDSQGFDTFAKVHTQAPEVPIVVLTVFDDDAVALDAVRKGAQDYLVKGQFDGKILSRVVRYAIERQRMRSTLQSLSLIDDLTGLYNRRGFLTLGTQHLKLAQRTNRTSLLLFADLDHLKQINDTYGHREGDRALVESAEALRLSFRTSDVLGRVGGDEFAIIAIEARQDNLEGLFARLEQKLKACRERRQLTYSLSLSMGATSFDPQHTASIEELMAQADRALYEQKRKRLSPPASRRP